MKVLSGEEEQEEEKRKSNAKGSGQNDHARKWKPEARPVENGQGNLAIPPSSPVTAKNTTVSTMSEKTMFWALEEEDRFLP